MKPLVLFVSVLSVVSGAAAADSLPNIGQCVWAADPDSFSVSFDARAGSGTVVTSNKTRVEAELLSLRKHSNGWKVNLHYFDEVLEKPTELVAFHMPSADITRMAIVGMSESERGLVIDYISGFEDAICLSDR